MNTDIHIHTHIQRHHQHRTLAWNGSTTHIHGFTIDYLISIHICMYNPHGVPPLPHGNLHSVSVEAKGNLGAGLFGLPAALEALRRRGLVHGIEPAVPDLYSGHHAKPLRPPDRSQTRIFIGSTGQTDS